MTHQPGVYVPLRALFLVFPAAVVYWNRLPCSVVTLPTLDQFSVAVRSHDHQMF